jgi:hypothetical protein
LSEGGTPNPRPRRGFLAFWPFIAYPFGNGSTPARRRLIRNVGINESISRTAMIDEKQTSAQSAFPPIAVATLLLLTAWGNAIAMLTVSATGLIVGAIIYRRALFKGAAFVAFVAFLIAAGIAVALSRGWLG